MKTLSNHILIYDRDCPLCAAYTGLFIRKGYLDQEGRKAYQDMNFDQTHIDPDLARNKIALLNTASNEVYYGINSMIKILACQFPLIGHLMKFQPLYWLMSQLYNLISFNRKIIIPVSCKKLPSCNPGKNWFWRISFVLVCLIPACLLLNDPIAVFTNGRQSAFLATMLLTAQIPFQLLICALIRERNTYDYIGQLSFVTSIAAHLLALLSGCLSVAGTPTITSTGIATLILLLWLLKEHKRRMKSAEMNPVLTGSLFLYWILSITLTFYIDSAS